MRSILGFLRATHPLPAAAVTLLVSSVAAVRGARGATLALVILSTAAGQASVGWSNDYVDRERDRMSGRTEKPLVGGEIREGPLAAAAVLALVGSVALSAALGWGPAVVMAAAVGSAWLYNLGVKGTVMSWVPYAVSFGLAPVYVWVATGSGRSPPWIVAATALLGVSGHLLNVIPDLEADRGTAVRGLPQRLGARRSLFSACAVLLAVLVLVLAATAPPGGAQLAAAAVATAVIAAIVWAGSRGRARLGFRLTIVAVGAIIAAFILSPSAGRP